MDLRIADILNDSIVDGPGLRLAVFFQGCPLRCESCHNPQSWDSASGRTVTVENVLEMVEKNPLLAGVTLTGGEPFSQPEGAAALAAAVQAMNLNVVVYTGHTWEEILAGPPSWREVLRHTDILIDGPYDEKQRSLTLSYRGSSNQRLIDVKASLREGILRNYTRE